MTDFAHLLHSYPHFRCTAGRSIIRMERKPAIIDSLHIPEIARDLNPHADPSGGARDIAYFGTVIKMTSRWDFQEDFEEGDRVWVMLLASQLGEEYILTENTRVYARQPH